MDTLTADTGQVESFLWIPGALLYLPVGVLAAIVVLELIDAFQKTRENDRAVLALLVLGLVTALTAAHIGAALKLFLGDWGTLPFRQLFLGYLLGFALLVTWVFKFLARRSWRKSAQMAVKHTMTRHRTSGSRFLSSAYGFFLVVSLILVTACVSYKADLGNVPAFVTLGVPGKAEDLPKPPPPTPPAPATTPAPAAVAQADPPAADPASAAQMESPAEMTGGGDPEMAAASDPESEPEPSPEPGNAEPKPQPLPAPKEPAMAAAPADGNSVDFASQVLPILKERCFECHGESKDKGDLRLYTPADMRKGGESGPVIVAGKPEDSSLYFLTTLDPMDEDIMPSKGDPLTKEQTEVLRTWILEGPYLADGKRVDDESAVASMEDGGKSMDEGDDIPLSTSIVIPNEEYLQSLRDEGIVVTPLAGDDFMLEIDYTQAGKGPGEIDLKVLYPLARNIVSLDLAKTKVTDGDLEPLREFKNLVHLRLDRCNVGDSALYNLSDLVKLESLNLFATRVTDSGMNSLDHLENLKELVVFNTLVTPQGAARLQKSLPDAEIQAPE